jgi:replication fork protection complex subunit Tof1/Swi1
VIWLSLQVPPSDNLQLGGSSADEAGQYTLGDDALACLRDLKRWLKLYDEKTNRLDVARCLAEAKLVTGDLLPILSSWCEETTDKLKARVALAALEILVPLTWPLETGGEMTLNHHRHTPYIQQAQVIYKAGILSWDTCSILRQVVRIGLPSIAMAQNDRTNRDEGIMKLVLYFLRNVTVISQIPNLPSQGLDNEVSRSATIEAFRQQDVFALLLTMCSNMGDDFNLQDVILLEILFNLVKGVDVKKLWMTEDQRKVQDVSELKDVLAQEKGMHRDYRKTAPTRHGRFGTMIWIKRDQGKVSTVSGQDNLRDGDKVMFNMDKTKQWNKPQQRRKDIEHTINDFDHSTRLSSQAAELLRNFAEEFLDSGFNPLFVHLRKAIEREAERLLDINYRQYFYTVSWFLEAERYRREKQQKLHKDKKIAADFEVESYGLVAGVLNQETFITLNRYMQTSYDNKEWQDLNANIRCFTQTLLMVQEMAQSPLEDDQEIADNIQNRIFYEEATHDRIIAILKGYKDQGFGYLDACTELSHVFLRMLERYSKENVDLQIRSKKRARRKRKEATKEANSDADVQDSEEEDNIDVVQVTKERKFDFTRFAAKFTSQSSIDTYIAFVTFYRDLSVEQLKRAHRFFHRVAFKQELGVLLYRVDIVALFYRMVKGPEGLAVSHAMYKDWSELARQLFKRMFKKLEQRPELLLEMLFSKVNNTIFYLEYGHEKQTISASRAPAELEVKPTPGRDTKEQIGIVVAALVQDGKEKLAKWVRSQVERAADERRGWEDVAAARAGEHAVEPEQAAYISVRPADEEVRMAMFKNARLRLLMKLIKFEMMGLEDVLGATWIIPSTLSASELEETKELLIQLEATPWVSTHEDETATDLLRRTRIAAVEDDELRRDVFIDDSEGDDQMEDFMFPDNIRQPSAKDAIAKLKKSRKRKHAAEPLEDEALEARRKAKEDAALDRRRKIKSELYIRDSDDDMDDEERVEFFKREEEGRKRQEDRIKKAMSLGTEGPKAKKSKVVIDVDMDEAPVELETASSQPQQLDSEESGTEETPLSSQESNTSPRQLKEISQSAVAAPTTKVGFVDNNSDEDDEPVVSTARRRVHGGFIVDSDDDE